MSQDNKGTVGAQGEAKRCAGGPGGSDQDYYGRWLASLDKGNGPVLYPVGDGQLGRFEIGPRMIALIGGVTGAGKTSLVMQMVFEALRRSPEIKALVCNNETAPEFLFDRELARLSGVDGDDIRLRRFDRSDPKIVNALDQIAKVSDRLRFVPQNSDIEMICKGAGYFGANIVVVDYIQRLRPKGRDTKKAVDDSMASLRDIANQGRAVVVLSAVSRAKDARGNASYKGSDGLASFRETSELEYGADNAWMLLSEGDEQDCTLMTLKHLKNRHGKLKDISLVFDRARQRFDPVEQQLTAPQPEARATSPRAKRKNITNSGADPMAVATERARQQRAGVVQ